MDINNSIAYQKAYQFAIRIVKAYKYLTEEKKEYVLSKQLLRSGTSIGANIAEANGGISQADFRAKMSIAYKETLETKYWLSLLKDTDYIEEKAFESIHQDADEISKILFAIVKKTDN
ncbi:MAG: four helix bundle protein [Cyanobacteriota bacterium]|nr:four helix bundle protein [Cyanobacteriota bacterium]